MRITTDKIAIEWLNQHLPHIDITDGMVVENSSCPKCGGSGYLSGYQHIQGGVCFACGGANTKGFVKRTPVKQYAQAKKAEMTRHERQRIANLKANKEREEKKLDGQRNWCEKNGYGRITFAEKQELERGEQDKKNAERQYVGEIKQTIELDVTLDHVAHFETTYGYSLRASVTWVWIMSDVDGNVLVWKTRTSPIYNGVYADIHKGQAFRIRGTVKKHEEYKNTKQTILTRCKIFCNKKSVPNK
jgi:hypothetical protein